jgi:fibrillarin-like pre-rRNA processing protein
MVKARSIDVSLKPEKVYEKVSSILEKNKMNVKEIINLKPYEKDHAAIIITK